jgi:hypothetical protein
MNVMTLIKNRNILINTVPVAALRNFLKFQREILCLRVTSHTRLRARDHSTSSTLIGGLGGAGPSSLHTTLEGLTEYVNAKWM